MNESLANCKQCGATANVLHYQVQDFFFGSPGIWNLLKCSSIDCGCVFPFPQPNDEELNRAYSTYYTHRSDDNIFSRVIKANLARLSYSRLPSSWCQHVPILDRLFEDAVMSTGGMRPHARCTIGDIGCGSGNRLDLLESVGWSRAIGVDPDPVAVSVAKNLGRSVSHGFAEQLPWHDGALDAVFLHHVIEHVRHPYIAFNEAFRVLKAGGRIAVITPNVSSETHQRHGPHWRGLEVPRHLTIFTLQALVSAMKSSGFFIEFARSSARGAAWNNLESQGTRKGGSTEGILARHRRASSAFRKQNVAISCGEEIGDELFVIGRRPFNVQ